MITTFLQVIFQITFSLLFRHFGFWQHSLSNTFFLSVTRDSHVTHLSFCYIEVFFEQVLLAIPQCVVRKLNNFSFYNIIHIFFEWWNCYTSFFELYWDVLLVKKTPNWVNHVNLNVHNIKNRYVEIKLSIGMYCQRKLHSNCKQNVY